MTEIYARASDASLISQAWLDEREKAINAVKETRYTTATIEYRVRPVTRWVVTRYEETGRTGKSEVIGEFDNELNAHCVRAAMTSAEREEHETMGVLKQAMDPREQVHSTADFRIQREAARG